MPPPESCIVGVHSGYRASFQYAKEERLPLLRAPTLVASSPTDIFFPELDQVAALVPNVRKAIVGGESGDELDLAVSLFRELLSRPTSARHVDTHPHDFAALDRGWAVMAWIKKANS